MRRTFLSLFRLSLASVLTSPNCGSAQAQGETVLPVMRQAIPNVPGKTLQALTVDYAPGGRSPSHHHAPSAFIFAVVLSGAVRSQVDDDPPHVFKTGESFFELPGSHHSVSEDASATEPARLLAVFVVDTPDEPLTIPDG
jgi:quercetin dioxygenase-like cupin family protein